MPKSNLFLYFLAFIEGAAVLTIELLGTKTIIPVLGNSLYVWSSIITVTISFLCLGYFFGSILVKKEKLLRHLSLLFLSSAFFIILIPNFSIKLLEKFVDLPLIYSSILISVFLIGPAIFLLGSTTPLIIQLLSVKLKNSGESSGNTYAISTLGGILSTLFIGQYILPSLGVIFPLTLCALFLAVLGILTQFHFLKVIFAIFLAILAYNNLAEKDSQVTNSYHQIKYISEGLMGQLKVVDEFNPVQNLPYRMLLINGICQTKMLNTKDKISAWNYIHQISMVASFKRGGNALLLGMGGGSIASELQKLNFTLDIVDIDERMFELAKKYFYFSNKKTQTFVDDARHFLRKSQKKYDLIALDLLSGESQPTNIFTQEGIKELQRSLTADGICVMEFQELINHAKVSNSIVNTFLNAGFTVQINRTDKGNQYGQSYIDDIIIVASKKEYNFKNYDKNKLSSSYRFLGPVAKSLDLPFVKIVKPYPDGLILSDDKPILDLLNAKTIQAWRKNSNNLYAKIHLENKYTIFK